MCSWTVSTKFWNSFDNHRSIRRHGRKWEYWQFIVVSVLIIIVCICVLHKLSKILDCSQFWALWQRWTWNLPDLGDNKLLYVLNIFLLLYKYFSRTATIKKEKIVKSTSKIVKTTEKRFEDTSPSSSEDEAEEFRNPMFPSL